MKVMTRTWEDIGIVKIPVMRMIFHCQGPGIVICLLLLFIQQCNVCLFTYLSESGDNLVIIFIPRTLESFTVGSFHIHFGSDV